MGILDFFGFGGDDGRPDPAAEARQREAVRLAKIKSAIGNIDTEFAGFNPSFYDNQTQSYMDYAQPQLDDNFADAKKSLALTLARGGQGQSSTAGIEFGKLKKRYDLGIQDIAKKGQQYSNNTRSGVESARSALISQANATADPGQISRDAARQYQTLNTLPPFDPIANTFNNLTSNIATAAQAHRLAPNGATRTFVSDLFGRDSGKVIT